MKPEIFSSAQALFRRVGDRILGEAPAADDAAGQARRRRRFIVIAAAGLGAGLAAVYLATHLPRGSEREDAAVDRTQAVTVFTLEPRAFTPRVALQGEARPQRDFRVYAPTSGVRILQLLADEGDFVRQGQALARLDTAVANAQLRAAQASVASAAAANVRAQDEYRRAESIRDSGALSAEAIEQRRAGAAAAAAQLAAARAQLAEVNARLGGGFVRAPAGGLVIQRMAEVGRPVDGQALFRIAGDNALEVAAQVAESDVLALRPGQNAEFRLVDGSTVTGRLRRAPAAIDSRTRTGEALFDLPRGTRVRAGMYLRGVALLAPTQRLAAPQSSVLYEGGQAYVFRIETARRSGESAPTAFARRVPVTTGLRDGEWVEISGAVEAGAVIVGSGAAFLQDRDPVRPIERSANTGAAQHGGAQPTGALRGRNG